MVHVKLLPVSLYMHAYIFLFYVLQVCRYICQSSGLQQFCPAAQPPHERCCSLQRHHLGEIHTT